jgi:hypothetical protein
VGTHPLYARFPDGEIRFGLYYGSTDTACPRLYTSEDEAWAVYGAWDLHYPPALDGQGEPVQLATNYGYGFWWPATATREWITSNRDWAESDVKTVEGTPGWLDEYFAAQAGAAP